jgi:hypothetical protein
MENRQLQIDLYTKIIPGIDYNTVYKKLPNTWVKLHNAHINTGFIDKHIEGEHTLGYVTLPGVSRVVVVDIDAHIESQKETVYSRYDQIVAKIGRPSFAVTSSHSGGIHMYYIFDQPYHHEDLKASFLANINDITNVDILTGTTNIRFPFGVGSNIIDPELPQRSFSHLNKYRQIELLKEHIVTFTTLQEVCTKHIKTIRHNDNKYEDIKNIKQHVTKITLQQEPIGFYAGNKYNSLIQLFNKSDDEKHFLNMCLNEERTMLLLKDPSRDLIILSPEKRLAYYSKFYQGFSKKRDSGSSKKLKLTESTFQTPLDAFQLTQLRKFLRSIPELKSFQMEGLTKTKSKDKFIKFGVRVMNELYKHVQRDPSIQTLSLPSVFLQKLDKNYGKMWKLLYPKITNIHRNYFNGPINYRCRSFDMYMFKKIINNIFKTKSFNTNHIITINNYNPMTRELKTRKQEVQNHYNILPGIISKLKKKREIMAEMGCYLVTEKVANNIYRRFYDKVLVSKQV